MKAKHARAIRAGIKLALSERGTGSLSLIHSEAHTPFGRAYIRTRWKGML